MTGNPEPAHKQTGQLPHSDCPAVRTSWSPLPWGHSMKTAHGISPCWIQGPLTDLMNNLLDVSLCQRFSRALGFLQNVPQSRRTKLEDEEQHIVLR